MGERTAIEGVPGRVTELDWLLPDPLSQSLYLDVAATRPVVEYHSHLDVAALANNRRPAHLTEAWISGDVWKWHAMRGLGVDESLISGKPDPHDAYMTWTQALGSLRGTPVHDWSLLELHRFLDLPVSLLQRLDDAAVAEEVWAEAQPRLREWDAGRILESVGIDVVCSTHLPTQGLDDFEECRRIGHEACIVPSLRIDPLMDARDPGSFRMETDRLGEVAGIDVTTFDGFLEALEARHVAFDALGARLSDAVLPSVARVPVSRPEAAATYVEARRGQVPTQEEADQYALTLLCECARMDAERGWTLHLHLGWSSRHPRPDGRDLPVAGPMVEGLVRWLDALQRRSILPRTLITHPSVHAVAALAPLVSAYQGRVMVPPSVSTVLASTGVEAHVDALISSGVIGQGVGFSSDARVIFSLVRHEVYRRRLCAALARGVQRGDIPPDRTLLEEWVVQLCDRGVRDRLRMSPSDCWGVAVS